MKQKLTEGPTQLEFVSKGDKVISWGIVVVRFADV